MILKSLSVAVKLLTNVIDKADINLTKEFTKECEKIVQKINSDEFNVELSVVKQSIALAEYFNINKLILSSYQVDPSLSFQEILNKILDNYQSMYSMSQRFATIDSKILSYIKKAVLMKCSVITHIKLGNGNIKLKETKLVFEKLVELKLGKCESTISANFKSINFFKKIKSEELKTNPEIGMTIQELGLNLNEVIQIFKLTEETEEIENSKDLRANLKRQNETRENSESPSNKISKISYLNHSPEKQIIIERQLNRNHEKRIDSNKRNKNERTDDSSYSDSEYYRSASNYRTNLDTTQSSRKQDKKKINENNKFSKSQTTSSPKQKSRNISDILIEESFININKSTSQNNKSLHEDEYDSSPATMPKSFYQSNKKLINYSNSNALVGNNSRSKNAQDSDTDQSDAIVKRVYTKKNYDLPKRDLRERNSKEKASACIKNSKFR